MAIVTEIREIRGLIDISLDGMSWLKVRKKHFLLLPLEAGNAIDADHYQDRLASVQAADCYETALTILDQASQTSGDMHLKLLRKGYVQPAAEAAVERLIGNGLIDDHRYAQRIAQAQVNKPVGAYAVRRKLRAKHIPEDAIDAAMEEFDGEQQTIACRSAAEKLWRKYEALPPREAKAKLSQALARRGFNWDSIHSTLDEICSTDDWDI